LIRYEKLEILDKNSSKIVEMKIRISNLDKLLSKIENKSF